MQEINRLNKELEKMDPNLPENRFKYANKKSEINILYKKLYELKERQKVEKENTVIDKPVSNGIIKRKILRKP